MSNVSAEVSTLAIPKGVGAFIDPVADLPLKKDFGTNSWFVIAHCVANGEVLNFLYHIMIFPMPGGGSAIQACVSITNETTGWYSADDIVIPLDQATIADTGFDIKMPNGRLWGTLDKLRVEAALADGRGKVEIEALATSPVIMNGGTGVFPLIDMMIHQYSVPRLAARGTITIDGKTSPIEGSAWFDRQWQNQDGDAAVDAAFKWSWMDINLDNGDAVSLWSGPAKLGGEERAWATILHADGSQTVAAAEPGLGARDIWHSEKSGARYPTRWTVRIPAMDAELEVTPSPREQEFVSQVPVLNKYEGASAMSGTWRGKPVRGFGYVELVGVWR
ncbi:mucin-1 (muc-1) [Novosphingobium sp. Rr 2-17]|uniref:lipocalin family protein n=1 Tax=Novosphingobium sp. Rr 2-17 TaxID=555793 RepID=UPI0002697B91|nr:lipocalin family protein [Novosphingobium sp. Rr 2-17]EIZ78317.1 mucin-1 (muc-1) [Novosphingobium sp. Rr 2-17]